MPAVKIWLVSLHDKDIPGEPDIGMAFHVGTEEEAASLGREMEAAMHVFGRCRCVSQVKSVETGRQYRMGALIRTSRSKM